MTAYERLIADLEALDYTYEVYESEDGFEVESDPDVIVWYFDAKGN